MKRLIKSWLQCERGAAFIEFVAVAPFLIVLVLGGVEVTRYATILLRLDKATYDMANIIAQEIPATDPATVNQITVTRVRNAMNNFSALMSPYDNPARQAVIVSSIQRESGATILRWRQAGGGSLGLGSIVSGAPGGNAGFTGPRAGDINAQLAGMVEDENMIVIETAYDYRPILQPVLRAFGLNFARETFRREHFFMPRNGPLRYLPPAFPPPPPPGP